MTFKVIHFTKAVTLDNRLFKQVSINMISEHQFPDLHTHISMAFRGKRLRMSLWTTKNSGHISAFTVESRLTWLVLIWNFFCNLFSPSEHLWRRSNNGINLKQQAKIINEFWRYNVIRADIAKHEKSELAGITKIDIWKCWMQMTWPKWNTRNVATWPLIDWLIFFF